MEKSKQNCLLDCSEVRGGHKLVGYLKVVPVPLRHPRTRTNILMLAEKAVGP